MSNQKNEMITQGKFRIEFPEELTQEEIEAIRMMVFKLLERNNCRVIPINNKENK
jgi:hypothetical protein